MKKLLLLLVVVVMVPLVWANDPVVIAQHPFEETRTIVVDEEEHVFTARPADFHHMNVSLSGDTEYILRLVVSQGKTILHQFEVLPGEQRQYSTTSGRGSEYTFTVETFRSQGQSFTFTYDEHAQNDAGSGMDAPQGFLDGLIIVTGEYDGFLGGGDTIDYYRILLQEEETITITAIPSGKEPLQILITDENLRINLRERSETESELLVVPFTSQIAQTISVGVEGKEPYKLIIQSDKDSPTHMIPDETSTFDEDDLPPPPPPFPGPVAGEQPGEQADSEPVKSEDTTVASQAPPSEWGWLLFISLLLLGGLVVASIVSKKKYSGEKNDESASNSGQKKNSSQTKKEKDAPNKKILS